MNSKNYQNNTETQNKCSVCSHLQFKISDPRGKMVQNVNFSPTRYNSNLSLNLNPTHQHSPRVCSISKTKPRC